MGIYRLIVRITFKNKVYLIPPPFDECYFGSDPLRIMTVMNPHDKRSCELPTFAISIYHKILESNVSEDYEVSDEGRVWFEKNFNDEYYMLLD